MNWAELWNLGITDDGEFTVAVRVDDGRGGLGEAATTLTVNNALPTLDAGLDQTAEEGTTVSLAPATFGDRGGADTHEATINWGDGTPEEAGMLTGSPFGPPSDTGTPTGTISGDHVYSDDGTYVVTVKLRDDNMPVDTWIEDTYVVVVSNSAPTVEAGLDQTANEGQEVSFNGSFTDLGSLDTHTIEWDFGDGTTLAGTLTPTHAYVDDGIYTVTLRVRDDDMPTDTWIQDTSQMTVLNADPSDLQIEEVIVNDGDIQRSNIETITVRFSRDANLQALIGDGTVASAVSLYGLRGLQVPLEVERFDYDPASSELTIDLTVDGPGDSQSTMLVDGRYQLRFDASLITAAENASNHLLDDDGTDDGVRRSWFHRLLGEFNGSADIDLDDRGPFFEHFGTTVVDESYAFAFDLNEDASIDKLDYSIWKGRFGIGLPEHSNVVGRHVFYNDSAFDLNDRLPGDSDDGAIAMDKRALLPGQEAAFANSTSHHHQERWPDLRSSPAAGGRCDPTPAV